MSEKAIKRMLTEVIHKDYDKFIKKYKSTLPNILDRVDLYNEQHPYETIFLYLDVVNNVYRKYANHKGAISQKLLEQNDDIEVMGFLSTINENKVLLKKLGYTKKKSIFL